MVDILLGWAHSRDWAAALKSAVPTRKRAAGEAGEAAAPEPAAGGKPVDAEPPGEPPASTSEAAAAGEPVKVATSQPANAAAAAPGAADDEPAQRADQPSSNAGGAASAVQEDADGEAEARGHRDVAERQPEGAGVGADAQQPDGIAMEPGMVEGEQPDTSASAVAVVTGGTPHSTADDTRRGDESVHAAKRQKTAAES